MTTAGQVTVQISLAVILVIVIAYTAGRVHQWYRRAFERDVAYREGYNQASLSLFPLAARKPVAGNRARPPAAARTAQFPAAVPFHVLDQQRPARDWPLPRSGRDADIRRG